MSQRADERKAADDELLAFLELKGEWLAFISHWDESHPKAPCHWDEIHPNGWRLLAPLG